MTDLGVSKGTVKRWLKDGKLKGMLYAPRSGYKIRFEDYEDFLEKHDKYYCKHVGIELVERRIKRDICREILDELDRMENEIEGRCLIKEYQDGWNDAVKRIGYLAKRVMK